MFNRILQLLRGKITVRAQGGFFERFLNLCALNGINIDSVCAEDDGIVFSAFAKDYRQIKKAAAKAGMETRIIKRRGLPFFVSAHRERLAIICGLAAVFLFLAVMSGRVWSIEVSGNTQVFSSEILNEAEKLGLKEGVNKSKLDIKALQASLLEELKDKIIWISVNIEGMRCEIQVREITKMSDGSTGVPCNITADFDGTITGCQVFSGTPAVVKGSGVKKGDLLISCVVEYVDGLTGFVEARGKITARHTVKTEEKGRSNIARRIYTGTKKLRSVSVFGLEIPLGIVLKGGKSCEVTVKRNRAQLNSVVLPFSVNEYIYSFYEEESVTEQADYTLYSFTQRLEEKLKNSLIISLRTKSYEKNGLTVFSAEADCVDSIGKRSTVGIENG